MNGGSESLSDGAQRPHGSTSKVAAPAECMRDCGSCSSRSTSSTQSGWQSGGSASSIGSSQGCSQGGSQTGGDPSSGHSSGQGDPSSGHSCGQGSGAHEDSEGLQGLTPGAKQEAREREARAEVNAELLYDEYFHAMDMAGVPDELVQVWAEDEEKLLEAPYRIPQGSAAGGDDLPDPIPQRAREVCLMVLHQFMAVLQLDPEAWFEAVSIFDAYIAASRCRISELPEVCAVLVRMLYKEESAGRDYTVHDFSHAPAHFSQFLAAEGLIEAEEGQPETPAEDLFRKEQEVLSALGWKIRLPSLAKWTEAFFRRLAVSVGPMQKDQVAALHHDCMGNVRSLTVLFPPSVHFPPQRVARGLLVLYSSRGRISPTPWRGPWQSSEQGSLHAEALAYLQSFEGVLGADPEALLQDCQLAGRALQGIGMAGVAGQLGAAPAAAPAATGGAVRPQPAAPGAREHDI